jgi:hypothetical protein
MNTQSISDDPLPFDHRSVLTVGSEEVCGWNWIDGQNIHLHVADADCHEWRFSGCRVNDG